jgi:hypothetical protein
MKRLLLALLLFPLFAHASSVTLAWDANTEPELRGYKLSYGTQSACYTETIDVGNVTIKQVTLQPGTYYFAVKAYGEGTLESAYSNEVYATLQGALNRCDVNADGVINRLDLEIIARMSAGTIPADFTRDYNGDGRINVLDLQILVNVFQHLRTCP